MPILNLYYKVNELQPFQNTSTYDQTVQRIPVGYHYFYVRSAPIYLTGTDTIVGTFTATNSALQKEKKMYCNSDTILFIENPIVPLGAINYINIFTTTLTKPNIPPGIYFPEIGAKTDFYYDKNIKVKVVVDSSPTRTITIEY